VRTALALAVALALGPAQVASGPRWATFQGVRVGGSQDDLLALNGDCRPLADVAAFQKNYLPWTVTEFAFGFSLPHFDRDTAAVAHALGNAFLCRVDVLDGRLRGWIVTIDRTVVGATFFPNAQDTLTPFKDSVRVLLVGAWGQPTAPVIIVDVNACSAFDRRVHRFSHRGTAQAC